MWHKVNNAKTTPHNIFNKIMKQKLIVARTQTVARYFVVVQMLFMFQLCHFIFKFIFINFWPK